MIIDTDKVADKVEKNMKEFFEGMKEATKEIFAPKETPKSGDKLTNEQVEKLVVRAKVLAEGMWERTGRLPDYADFRAAFAEELKEK